MRKRISYDEFKKSGIPGTYKIYQVMKKGHSYLVSDVARELGITPAAAQLELDIHVKNGFVRQDGGFHQLNEEVDIG